MVEFEHVCENDGWTHIYRPTMLHNVTLDAKSVHNIIGKTMAGHWQCNALAVSMQCIGLALRGHWECNDLAWLGIGLGVTTAWFASRRVGVTRTLTRILIRAMTRSILTRINGQGAYDKEQIDKEK